MAKLSKRELEELQHDEVADTLESWLEWFQDHSRQVITVGIALLVLLIVWLIYQSHLKNTRDEVNTQLNQILSGVERVQSTTDLAAKRKAAEPVTAALGAMIDQSAGTPLGREAYILRGNLHMMFDEYDQAQNDYKQYLETAGTDEAKARGEIALAYALENLSFVTTATQQQSARIEEARAHYKAAADITVPDSYLNTYARLGLARYNELTGHTKEAMDLYEEVMKHRPAPSNPTLPSTTHSDPDSEKFHQQIEDSLKNISFETAARLRLEKLRAQMGSTAVTSATTGLAAEAPVVAPAATATPAAQ